MTGAQVEEIAARAACLAVASTESEIGTYLTEEEYFQEYVDQLQNNDYQSLRTWIGWQIEEGNKEAVEIMKLLIYGNIRRQMI